VEGAEKNPEHSEREVYMGSPLGEKAKTPSIPLKKKEGYRETKV